ncbi:MAG: Hsp70 family protein [Deltaproteobacteria bacterium]|nr:Hsp70 family protein [Deltaproteobacteria bacterium]
MPRRSPRLGIDLGTTRTVVAVADRGNYPVVHFAAPDGDMADHYPTLSAEVGGALVHGLEAEAASRAGAPALRSWKRLLADHGAGHEVAIGSVRIALLDLAADFLRALRLALAERSNIPARLARTPDVVVSVPANAHSTQRFVTLEAFRRAGFAVAAVLNEPSAAGLEYAHRHRRTITARREHVVVYDLGGGTFDAALVLLTGEHHDVLFTSGVSRLGGDDFDDVLLALALDAAGAGGARLGERERASLLAECRAAKEGLHPNTRRIALELGALEPPPSAPVVVAVADFYERARPLVDRSTEALAPVLRRAAELEGDAAAGGEGLESVAGIYVVGGASGLPLVPRLLRERFGRLVHRSVYPSAATGIGLAIAAETERPAKLTQRFTRHLGVFREQEGGARISFDSIFAPGTPMPASGEPPLLATRSYRAAHNLGFFRFVECSRLSEDDQPCGDITPHRSVRFAFAPELRGREESEELPIVRRDGPGPEVRERYEVDAAGVVAVTLSDLDSGYERRFVL